MQIKRNILLFFIISIVFPFFSNAENKTFTPVIIKQSQVSDSLVKTKEPTIVSIGDSTIFFIFRQGSNILEEKYKRNELEQDYLFYTISKNKSKIQNGQSHLRIVTYVETAMARDTIALSIASSQANLLKALILKHSGINSNNLAFYIDSNEDVADRVAVEYIEKPISENESGTVYYNGRRIFTREDFIEFDYKGDADSTRIFRFDKEMHEQQLLDSLRAFSLNNNIRPLHLKSMEEKRDSTPIARREIVPVKGLIVTTRPVFAIKSDALKWAGILPDISYSGYYIPNISVEYYFARQWSIHSEFALRDKNGEKLFFKKTYPVENPSEPITKSATFTKSAGRVNAIDTINSRFGYLYTEIEPRFYPLEKDYYRYLFVGFRVFYGQYDNLSFKTLVPQGNTGDFVGAGVTVGSIIPIYCGLAAEFSIGASYRCIFDGTYIYYDNTRYSQNRTVTHSFDYCNIGVKLTYRFGKTAIIPGRIKFKKGK